MDSLGSFILILMVLSIIHGTWKYRNGDDSDLFVNDKLEQRSGFVVRTDYKTGRQYIGSSFYGLFEYGFVPRLDENGDHMIGE